MLRTAALATLLLNRLMMLGPMTETAAAEVLDTRAPGRSAETIQWACQRGLIQRVAGKEGEPATLEAAGTPLTLAAA